MNLFDHFVLAAPELEQAKQEFAELSGCMPIDGGAHTGMGTHNALCSFGPTSYLEIVAPDPAQDNNNPFTAWLAALSTTTPLHWAIRSDNLPAVAGRAEALSLHPGPIRDTQRQQPNGVTLAWQLMGLHQHTLGGLVPFFIDWQQCPHPATTSPVAGQVKQFEVSLPHGSLTTLLADTEGVTLGHGTAQLRLVLDTVKGEIEFQAAQAKGFGL